MTEDVETPEEDEDYPTCPVCRGDLVVRMLQYKSDDELGVSWGKYCHQCPDCGHRGKTWETLD